MALEHRQGIEQLGQDTGVDEGVDRPCLEPGVRGLVQRAPFGHDPVGAASLQLGGERPVPVAHEHHGAGRVGHGGRHSHDERVVARARRLHVDEATAARFPPGVGGSVR